MGIAKKEIVTKVFIACGMILFLFGLVNFINGRVADGNRNPPTSGEIASEYGKIKIYKEDRETDPFKIIAKSGLMIARGHYQTERAEAYLAEYYMREFKRIGYLSVEDGTNQSGERYFIFSSNRYVATLQFHREKDGLIYYLGLESKG